MRQEKQLLLDEIREKIDRSNGFLLTKYQAMDANRIADFRSILRKARSDFEVVRKRVLIKAASASGIDLVRQGLDGHVGVLFVEEDLLQATKLLLQFAGEHEGAVEILGGKFEGALYDAAQMKVLSKLPAKDEMRAQLLSVLEAPLSGTIAAMQSLLTSVIYCLENKTQQT